MMKLTIVLVLLSLQAVLGIDWKWNTGWAWIYDDKGSGANDDISCYRPIHSDSTYIPLGSVCVNYYDSAPSTRVPMIKNGGDGYGAVVSYNQAWNDQGSGGNSDGSFWVPVCGSGFSLVGTSVVNGYNPPPFNYQACLSNSYIVDVNAFGITPNVLVWADHGSGANLDGAVWSYGIGQYSFVNAGYGSILYRTPVPNTNAFPPA